MVRENVVRRIGVNNTGTGCVGKQPTTERIEMTLCARVTDKDRRQRCIRQAELHFRFGEEHLISSNDIARPMMTRTFGELAKG
jgi:hypothetical protein